MSKRMTTEQAHGLVAARGLDTRERVLAALVEKVVAKWGEGEREAGREMYTRSSYGLLLNTLAWYDIDAPDMEIAAAAKTLMTDADRAKLRKGG